jgi:hypothetical protein
MRLTIVAASLAALACLAPAAGGARTPAARAGPYRLEVVDESGRALPTFAHGGRSYVLGALGQRYLLRVRNDSARRIEAVVSVDGLDVIDGHTAGWEKRGYLVDPGGEVTIEGFRISTEGVAAFRFSGVPRSYAASKGDARDVGVIGVAVFAERERPRPKSLVHPRPDDEPRAKGSGASRHSSSSDGPAPPAPRAEQETASRSGRAVERHGLGTEFGEERDSPVRLVSFERASSRPDALLAVRYDDREGLLAAGVDVDGSRWARHDDVWLRRTAEPFRGSFAEPPPGWRAER